jgi:hypothetical protein
MPAAMANRGALDFPPAKILGYDGEQDPILAPLRSAVWTWRELQPAEATYLFTTVLAGAAARKCYNGIRIWDPTAGNAETAFGYAVVIRPTYKSVTNGVYKEVKLEIRAIAP